jgi:hypothetical protein
VHLYFSNSPFRNEVYEHSDLRGRLPSIHKHIQTLLEYQNLLQIAEEGTLTVDIQDALKKWMKAAFGKFNLAVQNPLHFPSGSEIEITERNDRYYILTRSV